MPFIETLGQQMATNAAEGVLGMFLGNYNDKRQLSQQQKLQNLQIQGQKEMMDYGYGKQLQMWKDTNYSAQRSELEKAGLNPGLLYGMGGGGGTTVGSAQGNVSGAQAPQGGGEVMGMMQQGLQLQLMEAQKKVLESQAELNTADAEKTKGVDTESTRQDIENKFQTLQNLRQDFEGKKLDLTMKNIENFEKQASQEDRLDYIEYQAKIAQKQMQLLGNQKQISDATIQDNIKQIKAEAVGAILKNILTQSQTDKTKSDIQVNNQTIRKMANDIMLNWDRLSNENKEIEIKKALMQWSTDPNREAVNQAISVLNGLIHQKKTVINNFNE